MATITRIQEVWQVSGINPDAVWKFHDACRKNGFTTVGPLHKRPDPSPGKFTFEVTIPIGKINELKDLAETFGEE